MINNIYIATIKYSLKGGLWDIGGKIYGSSKSLNMISSIYIATTKSSLESFLWDIIRSDSHI
jgi:hypothetical protein